MNTRTINVDELQNLTLSHVFVKILSEISFDNIRSIIDTSHMIAFLEYSNTIYVDGIFYGIPADQIDKIRENTEAISYMQDPEREGSLAYQISILENKLDEVTIGDNSIYNQLHDAIEDINNRISTISSSYISIKSNPDNEDLILSYENTGYGFAYILSLSYNITHRDEFNALYERLYGEVTEDGSIAYISRQILESTLIPEDAKEALDTLQEISNWIQYHPDEYSYIIHDIETLQEDVSTTYEAVDKLAYDVSRLNIDELITVEVNAAANKIESITVNNVMQEIYELSDDYKKNVNINIPITYIYDENTNSITRIENNIAYIEQHDVLKDIWIVLAN